MGNELEQILLNAIEEQEFTLFEVMGFKENIKLALLAGAAIGYQLGIAAGIKAFKKMQIGMN